METKSAGNKAGEKALETLYIQKKTYSWTGKISPPWALENSLP